MNETEAYFQGSMTAIRWATSELEAILHGGTFDDERLEQIVRELIQCADDPQEMAESVLITLRQA